MGGAGYAGTVGDWRPACAAAQGDARAFFEKNFTPYVVDGDALFTGYYEPEIRGRRTRGGAFQTPVYGIPDDLVRAELGQFNPKLQGEHISGRLDGHRLVPYATRAEINAKAPPAPVLFYTDDPVAFFFLQIQGSGRVVFEDGPKNQTGVRIAYAGENGQPYTAIGRTLIADGSLTREEVSLQSIRAWLAAHPDRAQGVMETDKSYIFFQERPIGDPALGSTGSSGRGPDALGQHRGGCAAACAGRAFLCRRRWARSGARSADRGRYRRRHPGRAPRRYLFRLRPGCRTPRRADEGAGKILLCCCRRGWPTGWAPARNSRHEAPHDQRRRAQAVRAEFPRGASASDGAAQARRKSQRRRQKAPAASMARPRTSSGAA